MTSFSQFLRSTTLCCAVSLGPTTLSAEAIELSQSQLRSLVSQQEILTAEAIIGTVSQISDGSVMDIRGFFDNGHMTYRVLVQRSDGAVLEVLMNGQDGQQISHGSAQGKAVAAAVRSPNWSSVSEAQVAQTSKAVLGATHWTQ